MVGSRNGKEGRRRPPLVRYTIVAFRQSLRGIGARLGIFALAAGCELVAEAQLVSEPCQVPGSCSWQLEIPGEVVISGEMDCMRLPASWPQNLWLRMNCHVIPSHRGAPYEQLGKGRCSAGLVAGWRVFSPVVKIMHD